MLRPSVLPAFRRFAFIAVLILTLFLPAAVEAAPLITIFVNGVRAETYPEVRNGVAYLPINAMAQALQAEITWDSRLNLVKVNGEAVGATANNLDGKIYLPVEAFVSALGGSVAFDGRENAIRITTGGSTTVAAASGSATTPVSMAPGRTPTPLPSPRVRTTIQIPTPPANPGGTVRIPPVTGRTPVPITPYQNSGGYSANTTTPGYPAPYAPNPQQPTAQPRPADAPPYLADNLQTGPARGATGGVQDNVGYTPMPANAQRPGDGVYVPRSSQNSVFQVTVTNLENVTVIKDFYRPRTGYKFVVVYLSQQNVSEQVQIYTGRFSLLDQGSTSYDYIEGLSNFWLVILRPFGINFGYLVFEVPVEAKPMSLVLHALNQAPLTLNL